MLAADILPGAVGSVPKLLGVLDGDVLLAAATPDLGTEPWRFPCGSVGINDVGAAHGAWLGPNPVSEQLRMELPGGNRPWTITIHDAYGKLVHQATSAAGAYVVPVRGWSKGLYHVLAESDEHRREGKVVVVQ